MPSVRVSRLELERNVLPRICARCGEPCDASLPMAMRTSFSSLMLGLSLTLAPPLFVLFALLLPARRTFSMPLCELDAHDWRWRYRWTDIVYTCLVAVTFVAACVIAPLVPDGTELIGFVVYYCVWCLWGVFAAILLTRTVRVSKVYSQGIELAGVHANFARSLMLDREADPERLAWYGDVRDDFEERLDWQTPGPGRGDK